MILNSSCKLQITTPAGCSVPEAKQMIASASYWKTYIFDIAAAMFRISGEDAKPKLESLGTVAS